MRAVIPVTASGCGSPTGVSARTNPLLALGGALVALAGGRGTATEVLDLASSAPVRHRFELDDDELAELTGWVERAGIRWGLAADLREPFGLGRLPGEHLAHGHRPAAARCRGCRG